MKNAFFAFFCFLLCFGFEPTLALDKPIKVEGRSTLANLDIETARDRALEAALRKAVEQGVGLHIVSQSEVDKYRLIYDKILSKSSGYVQEYEIISEGPRDGFYVVTISALVKVDELKIALKDIDILMEQNNLPRILVLIEEELKDSLNTKKRDSRPDTQRCQVELSLVSELKKRGFYVLDSKSAKKQKKAKGKTSRYRRNKATAWELASSMDADLVLIGDISLDRNKNFSDSRFASVSAELKLKLQRADTGEILFTRSWHSAGAGLNDCSAIANASKRVVGKAVNPLISLVADAFRKDIYETHILRLEIHGIVDFSHLDLLETELKNRVPGVKGLYRRSLGSETAVYDLSIKGKSANIAALLHEREIGELKLSVLETSQNIIKTKIVHREQNKKGGI